MSAKRYVRCLRDVWRLRSPDRTPRSLGALGAITSASDTLVDRNLVRDAWAP
jgi:hypothetical protein